VPLSSTRTPPPQSPLIAEENQSDPRRSCCDGGGRQHDWVRRGDGRWACDTRSCRCRLSPDRDWALGRYGARSSGSIQIAPLVRANPGSASHDAIPDVRHQMARIWRLARPNATRDAGPAFVLARVRARAEVGLHSWLCKRLSDAARTGAVAALGHDEPTGATGRDDCLAGEAAASGQGATTQRLVAPPVIGRSAGAS
jgi:hypothetical protein